MRLFKRAKKIVVSVLGHINICKFIYKKKFVLFCWQKQMLEKLDIW